MSLADLPNELVLHLATFLSPMDFVRFSLTSRRIYHLFNNCSSVWRKLLHKDLREPCQIMQSLVEKLLQSGRAITDNEWKLLYLVQKKTLMNWSLNNYKNFVCDYKGELAFDTSGHFLGAFVHFEDPDVRLHKRLVIHWFDEEKYEWRKEEVFIPIKISKKDVLLRVEDVKSDNQRAVIKISTSIPSKRVIICYDFANSGTLWCKKVRFSPMSDTTDSDIVAIHSKSYLVVCKRKVCVQLLMFDMNTGDLVYNYKLVGYKLGHFLQYCPLQNWMAFAVVPHNGFKPTVFTLDIGGKEGMKQLEMLGDPFFENYPLAMLDSQLVLAESTTISVWSLDSRACQYYIQLEHHYCFLTALSFYSKSSVDMVVGAWLGPYLEGHALHVLRVKGTEAKILYYMDRGMIQPASSRISFIGSQPILLARALEKDRVEEQKTLMLIGEKDSKYQPYEWPLVSDLNEVKYMSGAHVGIQVNGSFELLDFLHLDNYILNKSNS